MKIEIKAPAFPESVADGEVSLWHKQEGDFVQRDELLVEIETDKVVMEVVAPEAGRLDRIHVSEGSTIESEALLAEITPGEGEAAAPTAEASDAGSANIDRCSHGTCGSTACGRARAKSKCYQRLWKGWTN